MAEQSTLYAASGINFGAVAEFMDSCKKSKTDIHSLAVIHNGEVKLKLAPLPYSFDYKQHIYSLSKSFSATAAGFLVDDGIISIEDRVVDIFKDKCPKKIGRNLSKMRIKHLLSMNTGHNACLLYNICRSNDPVRKFLSFEPENEPGTHFVYNNAATYILSETVRRFTNISMFDFLSIRLFEPLEITNTHWDSFADGNSQAALGFYASAEDMAKLGFLYLNKGVYNGKRILSEDWTSAAVKTWSKNNSDAAPDWAAGYGFQFWRNAAEGFRGDGAFGQLSVALPSKNMVLAVQAYSEDTQAELNYLYELSDKLFGASDVTEAELKDYADRYNKPAEFKSSNDSVFDKLYLCEKNDFDVSLVTFVDCSDGIELRFSDGTVWQTMKFGKNKFCENRVVLKRLKPMIESISVDKKEPVHFVGCCTFEAGALMLYFNFLDNPHIDKYVCTFNENSLKMKKVKTADFLYSGEIRGRLI